MKIFALILVLVLPSVVRAADSESVAALFRLLDQNGDGTVTAEEVSEAQQPYFQRALRVADHNEDSQLNLEELQVALTSPRAVTPVTQGRRDGFDLTRLDRNSDGKISRDEVPAQMQQQFERVFQQLGDPVSIKAVQEMRSGRTAQPGGLPKSEESESKVITPDSGESMKPRARIGTQLTPANRDQFFDRLDRNGDGTLSFDEIPPLMRKNLQRAARDGDKSISREQFRRMTERQQKNSR